LFNPFRVVEFGSPYHTRFHRALFIFNPFGVIESKGISSPFALTACIIGKQVFAEKIPTVIFNF
jgi:hypothetical protein